MENVFLGMLAILVTAAFFYAKDFEGIASKRKTFARIIVATLAIGATTISSVFILNMFLIANPSNTCTP